MILFRLLPIYAPCHGANILLTGHVLLDKTLVTFMQILVIACFFIQPMQSMTNDLIWNCVPIAPYAAANDIHHDVNDMLLFLAHLAQICMRGVATP